MFGVFVLCLMILMGHFNMGKAIFAGENLRVAGKSVIVGCVLQIIIIELILCSKQNPEGL